MTFEELQHANSNIETKRIRGKDYAEVNQRVKAFRIVFPEGAIKTKLLADTGDRCVFQAIVTDREGTVLGTGTAYEEKDSSNVNRTSYIENCETSAVGRALGFVGFGIDTSIASAEEVENAIDQQSALKDTGPQPEPYMRQEAPALVPEAPQGPQQPAPVAEAPHEYNPNNDYKTGVNNVCRRLGLKTAAEVDKVLKEKHRGILSGEPSNKDYYWAYEDLLDLERKRQAKQEDVVV